MGKHRTSTVARQQNHVDKQELEQMSFEKLNSIGWRWVGQKMGNCLVMLSRHFLAVVGEGDPFTAGAPSWTPD